MVKLFFVCFLSIGTSIFSQEKTSVEKSIFNVQTGSIGVWINNEIKITELLAVRTEIGIEPSWFVGNGTIWHANVRLEPRYYYNLNKRSEKELITIKNSGNFFAIAMNYRPEGAIFSNTNSTVNGIESYSIIPKWGIRRLFAQNFNYEAGIGVGIRHETIYGNFAEVDLHLRIGYTF